MFFAKGRACDFDAVELGLRCGDAALFYEMVVVNSCKAVHADGETECQHYEQNDACVKF